MPLCIDFNYVLGDIVFQGGRNVWSGKPVETNRVDLVLCKCRVSSTVCEYIPPYGMAAREAAGWAGKTSNGCASLERRRPFQG